jgi:alkylation response protein AidB-like acyl-CoA dehydrogenase
MKMEWNLTEEQAAMRETARRFAEQELAPISREIDTTDGVIPESVLGKMAANGFFGMGIHPDYGGLGLDLLSIGLVTEELCRANLAMGSVIQRNLLCGNILQTFGTEEQKRRWLPGIASGEIQTCTSGTEPEAGSDAANIKTTARRDGERYIVNGEKTYTTFADRADLVFAYVRTSDHHKHRGISLLVIEKTPGPDFAPPAIRGSHIRTPGFHGMHSFSLTFDDLEVPAANLIGGEEGKGFYQLMNGYERARVLIGFRCLGIAQAAYDAAFRYTQERVQFDKKISEFQSVRFKIADMAAELTAARALAHAVAHTLDRGGRCDAEAGMVKLVCSEMAASVTRTAMLLHGGLGYALESDVNRYWRDGILMTVGEGTSDIQREIISRSLYRDG